MKERGLNRYNLVHAETKKELKRACRHLLGVVWRKTQVGRI
jgi:hypothetical protein